MVATDQTHLNLLMIKARRLRASSKTIAKAHDRLQEITADPTSTDQAIEMRVKRLDRAVRSYETAQTDALNAASRRAS